METKINGTNFELYTHKFITIGEIMLRLTPPNYEKSVWRHPLKQATAEVRQT